MGKKKRLPPIRAVRAFAKLHGLPVRDAIKIFRAEVLAGKHSPEGIRYEFSETERLMPGTYPGGDAEGYIPVYRSLDPEPIPRGVLMVADGEGGLDDKEATITAHSIRYRHVTYLLDDQAADTEPPRAAADAADDTTKQIPSGDRNRGRPTRCDEMCTAFDDMSEKKRLEFLEKSKTALYRELRRIIIEKTSQPWGLGEEAMARCLKDRLAEKR
jgi:hypothetical protein